MAAFRHRRLSYPHQITSNGKWNVTVEDTQTAITQVYTVDFVILCLGRFKDVPNIPDFPAGKGPEVFRGQAIHSMNYAAMDHEKAAEFVKGKRVVVVGFGKTGLDIAMKEFFSSSSESLVKPPPSSASTLYADHVSSPVDELGEIIELPSLDGCFESSANELVVETVDAWMYPLWVVADKVMNFDFFESNNRFT